jgi:hypothetical protein
MMEQLFAATCEEEGDGKVGRNNWLLRTGGIRSAETQTEMERSGVVHRSRLKPLVTQQFPLPGG